MEDDEFFMLAAETTALITVVGEVLRQIGYLSPEHRRAVDDGLDNALRIVEGAAMSLGKRMPAELTLHAVKTVEGLVKTTLAPRDEG